MLKFLHWLVTSSENPNKYSLAIKGIFGTIVSVVVLVAPFFHATVNSDQLTAVADAIVQGIVAFFGFVSVVAGIVGMIRKIHLSGPNPVELQSTPIPQPPVSPTV